MSKPMDLTRFDFYALRFRQSETVQQMTAEEVGQYLLLMVEAWLAEKEASLPNNPKLLAIYARCAPGQVVSPLVLSCWTERDGRLYNERLSEEWKAAKERHRVGVERATKGAEARYGKKYSMDAQSIPQASSDNAPIQSIAKPNQNQARPVQSNTGTGGHNIDTGLARDTSNLSITAQNLAKLLYSTLPLDTQDEAPENYETIWAADIQTLLENGTDPAEIETIIAALPRLARSKFVHRGKSFVKMYRKLCKDFRNLIPSSQDEEDVVVRNIDVEAL